MDRDPLDLDGWWHKKSARDKLRDWIDDRRRELRRDGVSSVSETVAKTRNVQYLVGIILFFLLVYGSYEYREWAIMQEYINDRCVEVMRDGQKVMECRAKDTSSFGSTLGVR